MTPTPDEMQAQAEREARLSLALQKAPMRNWAPDYAYDLLTPAERREVFERELQRRETAPVISELARQARDAETVTPERAREAAGLPRPTRVVDGLTGGLIGLFIGMALAVAIIVVFTPSAVGAVVIGQACGFLCTMTGVYLDLRRR